MRTLALPKELGAFGADTVVCCGIGENWPRVTSASPSSLTRHGADAALYDLATPYRRELFLERFKR